MKAAPFCPECGLPVQAVEGKTYMATDSWVWVDAATMEDTYQFQETTTFACAPCRVTIVFPDMAKEELLGNTAS